MATVRQQINIAVSARIVWNALTTAEGLTSWWVDEARVDTRPGGRIVITTEGDDGAPLEEIGMFQQLRPTRKIEITWDSNSRGPLRKTRLEFVLARDKDETRVAVIHSGIEENEDDNAALEKEWRQALLALRSSLES